MELMWGVGYTPNNRSPSYDGRNKHCSPLTLGLLSFVRLFRKFKSSSPSAQCPTAKYPCSAAQCQNTHYPCSAQWQSAQSKLQSIPAVPNCRISLQCPMSAQHPSNAQPRNILAVCKRMVSLQCPTAEYPSSAQLQNIFAMPNRRQSLQCPSTEYFRSAQSDSIPAVPNRGVCKQFPKFAQPIPSLVLGIHSCYVCRLAQ